MIGQIIITFIFFLLFYLLIPNAEEPSKEEKLLVSLHRRLDKIEEKLDR